VELAGTLAGKVVGKCGMGMNGIFPDAATGVVIMEAKYVI
jgi:hypothetical protein